MPIFISCYHVQRTNFEQHLNSHFSTHMIIHFIFVTNSSQNWTNMKFVCCFFSYIGQSITKQMDNRTIGMFAYFIIFDYNCKLCIRKFSFRLLSSSKYVLITYFKCIPLFIDAIWLEHFDWLHIIWEWLAQEFDSKEYIERLDCKKKDGQINSLIAINGRVFFSKSSDSNCQVEPVSFEMFESEFMYIQLHPCSRIFVDAYFLF